MKPVWNPVQWFNDLSTLVTPEMDHHEGFRLCEHDPQLVPERNPPTSDRKRDPIMMHSLVKYYVMELQKTIQHDIMEKLNEFTEVGVGDLGDLADPDIFSTNCTHLSVVSPEPPWNWWLASGPSPQKSWCFCWGDTFWTLFSSHPKSEGLKILDRPKIEYLNSQKSLRSWQS